MRTLRSLSKSRAFAGAVLAAIAIGAGVNFRVVGVVADIRDSALSAPMPAVYGCDTHDWFHVVVRTRDNAHATLAAVSREISNSGPLVDFDPPTAMERAVSSTWVAARTIGELLAAFSAFGLALGGVSVFTGTAYVIALRSREFGIRSALGADPWTLARPCAPHRSIPPQSCARTQQKRHSQDLKIFLTQTAAATCRQPTQSAHPESQVPYVTMKVERGCLCLRQLKPR